jgi:hypothetical protein
LVAEEPRKQPTHSKLPLTRDSAPTPNLLCPIISHRGLRGNPDGRGLPVCRSTR